jgi:Flp pilus assembly protein TadG
MTAVENQSVKKMHIVRHIRRLARASIRFRRERRGNVAITFAIALIPMLAFVGAAIDYSRANAMKVSLQAALDSTALMVAKNATKMSGGELQVAARSYFDALFVKPRAENVQFTASYSTAGGSNVVVSGAADMDTDLISILGIKKITVSGSSTAKWGSSRLRVALVLDNTGSMSSDGKMSALKTATKNLLTQLKGAATVDGDVYVSIIPFSKDVNAGSGNYNASWIDWSDWDAENRRCQGWQWGNYCFGQWVTANHNTWNGCVTDRGTSAAPGSTPDYDQKVDAPTPGVIESYFPAEQYQYCPLQMRGLSYDWSAMNSMVDQMQPDGSTNQPIGLVWGWQSLVGGGPLTAPAMDSSYKYQQVIILLSDGLNTQDRWYGNGSNVSTAVDNRMYQTGNVSGTCANIKAADVTIYAIQVNTGGDPTSTLLQNCASSSDKFFLLTSANQIVTTFNTIGTNLTKLRIAQ